MQILPVIDLLGGQVVRGVGGRRSEYKPIVSQLTKSTAPVDVALAFREHFGFDSLYLADLDAIAGKAAALPLYAILTGHGFRLWVDAGLRRADDATALLEHGVDTVIAGLETIAGPSALAGLVEHITPARVVFSLDLKNGRPLVNWSAWGTPLPFEIAQKAIALGVSRILVLDLAQVGVGAGVGTEALCRRLRSFVTIELAAGGGVRGKEDVASMRATGVDWLLVASALHDGRLTPRDVRV